MLDRPETSAPVTPMPVPTDSVAAVADVMLTAEEIAREEISLHNSPAKIIEAMQRVIAARLAKINADNDVEQAHPSAQNLDEVRKDLG